MTSPINPAQAALKRFETSEDPTPLEAVSAPSAGIGSAPSTVNTATLYPECPAPSAYTGNSYAVPRAHSPEDSGSSAALKAPVDPIPLLDYPAVLPPPSAPPAEENAPPAEIVLTALQSVVPTFENPEMAISYVNQPIESLIPDYKHVKHEETPIDRLFSNLKREANQKNFTLNPSEPISGTSNIAQLGSAIVDQAIAKTVTAGTSSSLVVQLKEILAEMDLLIAKLHNKNIPKQKKALIEVALRSFCTTYLHSKVAEELYSASTGKPSFHPAILEQIEDLHLFLTKQGAFKPVLEVTTLVAEPLVSAFAQKINIISQLQAIGNAVERFTSESEQLISRLENSVSVCEDLRKSAFIEKVHTACIQRALPNLENRIVSKAIRMQQFPGRLVMFAAELRSLKMNETSFRISITTAIENYFLGTLNPDETTLEKKLELFHHILSGIADRPLKASIAVELLKTLHQMEMSKYEEAARRNTLPENWVSELSKIGDCLTRSGEYVDGEEEPLQLAHLLPSQRESIKNMDLVGRPLLNCLYQKNLAAVDASISSRSKALSRELSLHDKVPLYLEQIAKTAESVSEGTDATNRLFGKVFITRLLHKQFAEELKDAAVSKAATQIEAYHRTGYLPLDIYGDATALHHLETNNGMFTPVGQNALQRQIENLFGKREQIENTRSVVIGMQGNPFNTAAQAALYTAQVETLNWALTMSEDGRSEFIPPPFFVPAPRAVPPTVTVVEAPIEEPVSAPVTVSSEPVIEAPAPAAVASAPVATAVRPEWISVRATDEITINETDNRSFDQLPTEMQLCILSNIVMSQLGSVEQRTLAYLPKEEERDYRSSALRNNARRDYDPLNIARNRLAKIESELPGGDDLRTLAKQALAGYALRNRTFQSKVTLDFLRDRGFGEDGAFLKAVYDQAKAEAQGFDVSEGNLNWAAERWYADTQIASDPIGSLRATRRVAQALERVILSL